MKRKRDNLEDDSEVTLVEPRFDEVAKEAARPVVPLSRVTSADLYGGAMAGGPRAPARYGRHGWPHIVAIMLAVAAVAAVVTAAAIYRSARTPAPAAAPQTVNETTVAPEAETAGSAPEPAAAERAPEPEPASATTARENGTAAPAQPARPAEARVEVPPREEPEDRVRKDNERRARDEEKLAERAREEERKQAEREEKEAERLAEKQRDQGKREETRPRLVGIYTERRKP
ncbi:MAG TPA: hypothetical protein VD861_02215 [Pyrinomonadaceae bacterium]|nr:hypothetical protein [Pyrinomonadaceae bacterium]